MLIAIDEKPSLEQVLKGGNKEIASFDETRGKFRNAMKKMKRKQIANNAINTLEGLWKSTMEDNKDLGERRIDLTRVRNAIAHHDFDIKNGIVRIRWVHYARKGEPSKHDILDPRDLESNLYGLRGLYATFLAWEDMIEIITQPSPSAIVSDEDMMRMAESNYELMKKMVAGSRRNA
jgi:hypothetical protein